MASGATALSLDVLKKALARRPMDILSQSGRLNSNVAVFRPLFVPLHLVCSSLRAIRYPGNIRHEAITPVIPFHWMNP